MAASVLVAVMASFIGDPAAIQLETIFEMADTMIPFAEIVMNPNGTSVPDPQREPNELFMVTTHIGNRCHPEHWSAVSQYIRRLPIEIQGICMSPIIKRHPELVTTPEYMEYTTRTAGLVI